MTDNNDWMDEPIEYATYSPEDDKLRIYSDRVSTELYDVLKGLGFGRAYKQGCFFATWSPRREDMVLNLCDEIIDEESTLAERAEDRHARFATYQANAASRSERAHRASSAATEGIPFGQPILVGHHSEKRHRKAVETACRQADKAVEEARRSKYWNWRAAGVLRHASYATNVNVVRGRIKTLKAALRKKQRERSPDMNELEWMKVDFIESRHDILGLGKPYGTRMDELTPAERDLVTKFIKGRIDARQIWADRWIAHLEGRIEYWKVFVEEVTGESADTQLPLEKGGWVFTRWGHWAKIVRVNRDREGLISSVSIDKTSVPRWTPRIIEYRGIREYSPPSDDPPSQPLPKPVAPISPELNKLDELQAHKQTLANVEIIVIQNKKSVNVPPEVIEVLPGLMWEEQDGRFLARIHPLDRALYQKVNKALSALGGVWTRKAKAHVFDEDPRPRLDVLGAGDSIVTEGATDYYPTPLALVERMVDLAKLPSEPCLMCDPSAGDGRIAEAVLLRGPHKVHCCEIHPTARTILEGKELVLVGSDFMEYALPLDENRQLLFKYDRFIMNPPFSRSQDIDHVLHAWRMMTETGVLVSIMSSGSITNNHTHKIKDFQEWLYERRHFTELLPHGTFKESGTNIQSYLVVIYGDATCTTNDGQNQGVTRHVPWAVTDDEGLPLSITQDQLF